MLRGLRVSFLVAGGAGLGWCIGLNALNILMRGIISAGGPRSACVECHSPSLNWVHLTHSMKQAFDVLRQLRAFGLPVHAWP